MLSAFKSVERENYYLINFIHSFIVIHLYLIEFSFLFRYETLIINIISLPPLQPGYDQLGIFSYLVDWVPTDLPVDSESAYRIFKTLYNNLSVQDPKIKGLFGK